MSILENPKHERIAQGETYVLAGFKENDGNCVRLKFWTDEMLQDAAIGELLKHGGNRDDLSRLREYFRKRAEAKYQDVLIPADESAQIDQLSPLKR